MLKLRSSLNPIILKRFLVRGSCIAFLGVMLLFLTGIYLPLQQLKTWGFPILVSGFALIASGMIPYKKLSKLELAPHEIYCDDKDLTFIKSGSPLFRLSLERIDSIDFVEKKETYGIAIKLKRPAGPCLTLLKPHQSFATFASDAKNKVPDSDLFLPYFNQVSFRELKELLETETQAQPE